MHQWILDENHVLMLGTTLGTEGDRCLEDMFAEDYYLGLVQESYKKELGRKKLKLDPPDKRTIVHRVEAALSGRGIEKFNKGRVAKRIMNDLAGKSLADLPEETAENFRKVIAVVNKLVSGWRSA